MSELIAQGSNPDHRWRRLIPVGEILLLGRTTPAFRVPWDDRVSREHVRMELSDGQLRVEKILAAANPVFYLGRQSDKFSLQPGEHFVIGKTTFTLTKEQAHVTLDLPSPIRQRTYSPEYLRHVQFRDAEQRIDVLNRLPDVISSAGNEQDLLNRLSNTLLAGITSASTIGIVRCQASSENADQPIHAGEPTVSETASGIEILHWDRRGAMTGDFQPSEKLIRQAIASEETVLHLWRGSREQKSEFTMDLENDWAFVCPLDSLATPGWGIYVTGLQRGTTAGSMPDTDAEDRQGDVKFCQLVGAMLKSLLQVRQLERRQTSLRGFFSPIVLEAFMGRDPDEVLTPQKCHLSVMFCDLRGFSKKSEAMGDELFQLLNRVSRSLDVMTKEILSHGGVIGDFHGDSAMGFWGWPLRQTDTARRAIQAALAIEAEFRAGQTEPGELQIGIGIATGIAVAGKIGSRDQVKVTAFGPVVNLASRLEGLNRLVNSSLLIDRATMEQVSSDRTELGFQIRGLGRFQPYGMSLVSEVFQVLSEPGQPTSEELDRFVDALTLFQAGNWLAAGKILQPLPRGDSGRQFLLEFMQQTDGHPPSDWNGVVQLKSK